MESHQPHEVHPLLPTLDLEGDLESVEPDTSTKARTLRIVFPVILAGVALGLFMAKVMHLP